MLKNLKVIDPANINKSAEVKVMLLQSTGGETHAS